MKHQVLKGYIIEAQGELFIVTVWTVGRSLIIGHVHGNKYLLLSLLVSLLLN